MSGWLGWCKPDSSTVLDQSSASALYAPSLKAFMIVLASHWQSLRGFARLKFRNNSKFGLFFVPFPSTRTM
jgi:hypothetical protein